MKACSVSGRVHAAAAVFLFILSVVFLTLHALLQVVLTPEEVSAPLATAARASSLVPQLALSVLGLLVILLRPRNPIGWLLSTAGVILGAGMVCSEFAPYAYQVHHDRGLLMLAAAMADNAIWVPFEACLAVLLLLFPTGRPLSRAWAIVLRWGTIASAALFVVTLTARGRLDTVPIDNPIGLPFVPMSLVHGPLEPGVIFLGVGLVAIARRLWASRGEERQQLKWLTLSASFTVPTGIVAWGTSTVITDVAVLLFALAISMIPISIAIAILKYRLYDIDVLINRTLVYGLLTVTLGAFYLGTIILLQAALRATTSQSSDLAIVVATLAIAALFNPWRRRLQSFIDRRFYRRKYDAAQALASLQGTLRDEVDLDRLTAEVVTVVQDTVEPRHIALWLRGEKVS